MRKTDELMRKAIHEWLAARADFHAGGMSCMEAYCAADTRLLATFAADWSADNTEMCASAYQEFRKTLVTRILKGSQ
jgi:hypothetical protein